MTDTVIYNIKKKLLSKIKKKLKYIIDGYEVVFEEQDGCDEYGFLYWIECKNGYSSRSWDLNYRINKAIDDFYMELFINGIYYRNKRYFIKPSKNISSVKDITLIDYDQYMIYYNNFIKYNEMFQVIVDKINTFYNKQWYKHIEQYKRFITNFNDFDYTLKELLNKKGLNTVNGLIEEINTFLEENNLYCNLYY